jgi:hypothetical protein
VKISIKDGELIIDGEGNTYIYPKFDQCGLNVDVPSVYNIKKVMVTRFITIGQTEEEFINEKRKGILDHILTD